MFLTTGINIRSQILQCVRTRLIPIYVRQRCGPWGIRDDEKFSDSLKVDLPYMVMRDTDAMETLRLLCTP